MRRTSWARWRAAAIIAVCGLATAAVPAPPLPAGGPSAEVAEGAALSAARKAAPEQPDYDVKGSLLFASGESVGRVAWVAGSSRNASGLLATVDRRGRVTSKVTTGLIYEVLAYPAPKSGEHAEAGFVGLLQQSGAGTGSHQVAFSLHDPVNVSKLVFRQLAYESMWQPTGPGDVPGGMYTLRRSTFAVTPERVTETRIETADRHGYGSAADWEEPTVTVHQYAWNAKKQRYLAVEAKPGTVVGYGLGQ